MYKIIVCTSMLCLYALPYFGQHSCCSSSAASVTLGTGSNSSVLEKNQLKLDLMGFYWQFKPQAGAKGLPAAVADVHYASVSSAGVYYGLTKSVTLSVVQPYLYISSEVYSLNDADIVVPTAQTSTGLGDMAAMATWQLPFDKSVLGAALIGGVEFPTGYRDIQNSSISTSIGSGSYDPMVGISLAKKAGNLMLTASTTYKVTTVNDLGIDYGDFSASKIQASYSFNRKKCIPSNDSLNATDNSWQKEVFTGMSFDGLFKQQRQDSVVLNTGYERLYTHFGISIGYNNYIRLSMIGELPITERIHGYQNTTSFRARMVLSITI